MKKALFTSLIFIFCCTLSIAQDAPKESLAKRFADWRERSMMKGCDTTYIQLPENAWTIKLNGISTFSHLSLRFNNVTG